MHLVRPNRHIRQNLPSAEMGHTLFINISHTTFQVTSCQDPDIHLGVCYSSALIPFLEKSSVPDPEPIRILRKKGRPKKYFLNCLG